MLDEVLFYGGVAVALVSLIGMIVYLSVWHRRRVHLKRQMEAEYGKAFESIA